MNKKLNLKLSPSHLLALAASMLAAGCTGPVIQKGLETAKNEVLPIAALAAYKLPDHAAAKGTPAAVEAAARRQAQRVVGLRAQAPFIGSRMVPVTGEDKLPRAFFVPYLFRFDDLATNGRVPIQVFAERISAVSGVPVRIKSDVLAYAALTGGPTSVPAVANVPIPSGSPLPTSPPGQPPLPPAGMVPEQGVGLMVNVSELRGGKGSTSTLASHLEYATNQHGLSWDFIDGAVVIERFVTEAIEVATLGGKQNYNFTTTGSSMGTAGDSQSGSQDTSSGMSVGEEGNANAAESMFAALKQMVSNVPGSSVQPTDAGHVVVTTTKDAMSRVRAYAKRYNEVLLRQAAVQFDVYSFRTELVDERGVDWNLVFNNLSRVLGVAMTSPATLTTANAGGVTLSILGSNTSPTGGTSRTSQALGNSTAILGALSSFGTNAQHKPISLLTLNRQWARKNNVQSDAYVNELLPGVASSTGVGVPGIKTSSVTYGDHAVAMPYLMDNNQAILKFGLGFSDLLGLPTFSAGSGDSATSVQVPRLSLASDQATVKLEGGQVLAITGLSRLIAKDNKRTLSEGASVGAGGSRAISVVREHFLVFVRVTQI